MKIEYFPNTRMIAFASESGSDLLRIGVMKTRLRKSFLQWTDTNVRDPNASQTLEVQVDDVLALLSE